jgi:hypothetical protein
MGNRHNTLPFHVFGILVPVRALKLFKRLIFFALLLYNAFSHLVYVVFPSLLVPYTFPHIFLYFCDRVYPVNSLKRLNSSSSFVSQPCPCLTSASTGSTIFLQLPVTFRCFVLPKFSLSFSLIRKTCCLYHSKSVWAYKNY